MAINNPDDPYRSNPDRINPVDGDVRQARLEGEMQADPQLAEGPASGARVAMFALAIAVVLGAVFYGLNNSSVNEAGTTPATSTAQNTERTSPPAAPTGMRDVTPRSNTEPGTTTGAAPARPAVPVSPPSSAPTGTEVNRSATPPANPTSR
ncbi:MAG: hypothetical protein Q7J60_13560 [Bradyrhizobium sp.]|uniref:hypothetical protein n=1 Tax=Bradyrhizobium sp. TaxID=376 RepID=UPI00271EA060|nr:hypothetical protein [Bradyrhizobium sp.]MDO9562640.1 hypothetical protein [Bradyrhizobium sp.]MDP3691091.1 hypothetical protein [Bradyrhizobium sp.]